MRYENHTPGACSLCDKYICNWCQFQSTSDREIDLHGFDEQNLPLQCPQCDCEMDSSSVVGYGKYPAGGYWSNRRPNIIHGIGFKCPKCFTKSAMQCLEKEISYYINEKWSSCFSESR